VVNLVVLKLNGSGGEKGEERNMECACASGDLGGFGLNELGNGCFRAYGGTWRIGQSEPLGMTWGS
jgi:hypothetical protein